MSAGPSSKQSIAIEWDPRSGANGSGDIRDLLLRRFGRLSHSLGTTMATAPASQKIAFFAFPILGALFSGGELYQRASIELNGTIVASDTTCMQPQNNRCATEYIVENAAHSREKYIAGPTDHSLPRRLPIGTTVAKEKWSLSYRLNGRETDDFPLQFYIGAFVVSVCVGWWAYARRTPG